MFLYPLPASPTSPTLYAKSNLHDIKQETRRSVGGYKDVYCLKHSIRVERFVPPSIDKHQNIVCWHVHLTKLAWVLSLDQMAAKTFANDENSRALAFTVGGHKHIYIRRNQCFKALLIGELPNSLLQANT